MTWLSPTVAPLMAYRNRRLCHIITQAGQVIAPTHFVQTVYEQMGVPTENVMVVPHGIEVPHQKIEAILAKRPFPPKNTLRIGYIGSIAQQKGVHNLIAAVNQLPKEGVKLTIYGGLDDFPEYVAQIKASAQHPGIHFAGRIPREEIWDAFASFDVVVMPTLWYEASPLTIQEAFAVKTPIIASRIGAMPEKITDGVDGLLVPPGDVAALHTALLSLKENPARLAQLRAGIQPVYTMTEQVKDIIDVYRKYVIKVGTEKPA
ncbi:MAG: glycosyltransferase [Anaerolineae bacterium]|nr:glycosyltransferase [Anaerolineae bacterium]